MRIKSFLRLSGVLSVPILSLAVMGIVHGMWFDPERNMERMDAELYSPPIIQYGVYYLIFVSILTLHYARYIAFLTTCHPQTLLKRNERNADCISPVWQGRRAAPVRTTFRLF